MFERKVFNFDTRDIITDIMASMMRECVCNNMQEVGLFIDRAQGELSRIASMYYLARISSEGAVTMAAVAECIRSLVYKELVAVSNNITESKLDKAMALIYRDVSDGYRKSYPYEMGAFDSCRMTQTSFTSFSIIAVKTVKEDGSISTSIFGIDQGKHQEAFYRVG